MKKLRNICLFLACGLLLSNACWAKTNSDTTKTTDSPKTTTQKSTGVTDKLSDIVKNIEQTIADLTPKQKSALDKRLAEEDIISSSPFGIALYQPTYVLPFYYTQTPYNRIYKGTTPNDQRLNPIEFKAQLSFKVALLHNFLGKDSSFNMAYTQLMYWQLYTNSPYFRETNYEPEIFISKKVLPFLWTNIGAMHQSNGRGGDLERSWNRAYISFQFAYNNLLVDVRPWVLIFKSYSSNLDNPDIARYLGHGDVVIAYKAGPVTLSMMLRNTVESGFKRGAEEFDVSLPVYKKVKVYIQVFSGYGQSLIEYNHYTNSAGIGISLSDWL